MTRRPLSLGEAEEAILDLSDQMEATTEAHAEASDRAADAEAEWKLAYFRRFLEARAQGMALPNADGELVHHPRPTEKMCEALATVENEDAFRAYKITAASAGSLKSATFSQTARLNALQTIAANIRNQT